MYATSQAFLSSCPPLTRVHELARDITPPGGLVVLNARIEKNPSSDSGLGVSEAVMKRTMNSFILTVIESESVTVVLYTFLSLGLSEVVLGGVGGGGMGWSGGVGKRVDSVCMDLKSVTELCVEVVFRIDGISQRLLFSRCTACFFALMGRSCDVYR
jgi:hypothetical protein